jgi:AraC-like DNA-binding protein
MMQTRPLRLADTAFGAPYYAHHQQLHSGAYWKRIDYYEIIAVVGGNGRLSRNLSDKPRNHDLHAGMLVMLRPGEDLLLSGLEPSGVELLYVSFPTDDWRAYARLAGIESNWADLSTPVLSSFEMDDRRVVDAFRSLVERFRSGPARFDLVEFLVSVTPRLFPPRATASNPLPTWLVDSLEAMHEEENLRGGVRRMLRLANVSRPYLAATTQRLLGVTPTSLVSDIRLRHAATLLTTTQQSITEISARCGFSRLNYFSTIFHGKFGMTPRAYRQRMTEARPAADTVPGHDS